MSKEKSNEVMQWVGAVLIVAGHTLNSIGPAVYPYNVLTFLIGTILFLWWAIRVNNRPQLTVNIISVVIMIAGLYKAWS
jgi:hypothetical protein